MRALLSLAALALLTAGCDPDAAADAPGLDTRSEPIEHTETNDTSDRADGTLEVPEEARRAPDHGALERPDAFVDAKLDPLPLAEIDCGEETLLLELLEDASGSDRGAERDIRVYVDEDEDEDEDEECRLIIIIE